MGLVGEEVFGDVDDEEVEGFVVGEMVGLD